MAKEEEKTPKIAKARYWWAVLYQENMRPDWREAIDDLLQLPYAYCEHTADKDSRSEHRKDHVHIIVAKSNTTSYKHIMEVFNLLSAPGKKALNTCEACVNIRHCYDYLIHDTDSCRKQGKEQYDPSRRITGNNFDIGAYEQISSAQKQEMLKELVGYIIANGFTTINDFTVAAMNDFDGCYWEIIVGYNGTLERYCRGNYLKRKAKALEKRMGYRPAIELDEETRAQRVYTDKSVDIDKVRGAVDRAVVQPAEDEAARIVAAAREEAAALLNDAEARKADLVTEIADKEGDLAELDSQLEDVKLDIEDEQDRLECLRQRADGVARDVGELRSIAAEVRGWEAAGKAERGAILDRIAAQCDGLASRIRAGVAGIRLKVEELRSRISRPLEYLMRREQPRQQSLNDVLRDAQRAADAWNRDHAAPQRTYRGRAR